MAIKENALPVSQSIGSGDYLRKVSSGGVSQQVPFSEVKDAVVTVDSAIDSESENPVQNKAIAAALDAAGTQTQQAIATAIQTEVTDRNSAISQAISTEVSNRNQAIASAIQTETADRTAAIQEAIADEVTDRNAAIASAIDDEETARNTAISEAVAAEAQAREAAVEELDQTKANTDGNYPDMTVGNADQLLSSIYTEDQIPYNFRQSGGGLSIGDREIDKIVGGTIAWNQLVQNGNFDGTGYWGAGLGTFSASENELTYTLTSVGAQYYENQINQYGLGIPKNHIIFSRAETFAPYSNGFYLTARHNSAGMSGGTGISNKALVPNQWNTVEGIGKPTNDVTDIAFYWNMNTNYQVGDSVKLRNVFIIDLTQMFGSAIADYIYSLEQATAGAGVAYFRKLFPKPYYAYNSGELMSVQAASHDMVGFNQFDKDTAVAYNAYLQNWSAGVYRWTQYSDSSSFAIRCLPNTTYCAYLNGLTPQILRLCSIAEENLPTNPTGGGWYIPCDGEAVTSSNGLCTYTTGENSKWLIVQISSQFVADGRAYDNLCINLSHNGSRNGEYEPYEKHSYELDSGLTLRGIPKLDASNNLYYDGDEYESDGSVNRRYGVVDLGTLEWATRYTETTNKTVSVNLTIAYKTKNGKPNLLPCGINYIDAVGGVAVLNNPDSQSVGLYSYTQGTGGESAYSTLYVVLPKDSTPTGEILLELATPTEESAAPYTNPQTVSDWGTEEYVDAAVQEGDRDVAVPVGHVTDYLANLRDKLQNLPDAANADGTYLVQQTSGQMALLAYTPGANIPAAPTTDGTYTLQAVVSGGVATYSWVSS